MAADELGKRTRTDSSGPVVSPPLTLRLHPDPVLRGVCHPVEHFDTGLSNVVDEMLTLMQRSGGIGLAAPQVGIAMRFFVAQIGRRSLCLVNPAIVTRDGSAHMTEGCLSLPGVDVNVTRNAQIEVQGFDVRGRSQNHRLEGLWARVIQHEIDHLDGILICDYQNKKDNANS